MRSDFKNKMINATNFEGSDKSNPTIELKPYEKVLANGAESLSDVELLAVILRTGTRGHGVSELSRNVLMSCTKDEGIVGLCSITIPELIDIKGIGVVKAVQIKCLVEFARRLSKKSIEKRTDFSRPDIIAEYYMQDMMHLEVEKVILLMLDSKCRFLRDTVMSQGTVNSSSINPREIFIEALKYRAVSFVLIHNHPSGDPTPSKDDILFTKRLKSCADLLGVALLDHIIIGNNMYVSLNNKGIIR